MALVINVDKIEKIYTHKAKQAPYVYYNEGQPEKRVFFGLIKIENEIEPHWRCLYHSRYDTREDLVGADCSDEYFIKNDVLYENSIWQKSYLYIIMSHSDNVSVYYDSDEEMIEKLNKIILESKKNLMVINN
jgi:hypothetical protein